MPVYKNVGAETVSLATKQTAKAALEHACRLLGLALPPQVLWCRPVIDPGELKQALALPTTYGFDQPDYIYYRAAINGLTDSQHYCLWVRADLTPSRTAFVVAHEVAHLSHRLRNQQHALPREEEEVDCDAFAQKAIQALDLG